MEKLSDFIISNTLSGLNACINTTIDYLSVKRYYIAIKLVRFAHFIGATKFENWICKVTGLELALQNYINTLDGDLDEQ